MTNSKKLAVLLFCIFIRNLYLLGMDAGLRPALRQIQTMPGSLNPNSAGFFAQVKWDNTIKIWDINKQQSIGILAGHNDSIYSVSWDPTNSDLIASGSRDKTVKIWNVKTQKCICTFKGHNDTVYSLSWSPKDPNLILSGSNDKTVKVWDLKKNTCICSIQGHMHPVVEVAWHPINPDCFASVSVDGTIKIWNLVIKHNFGNITFQCIATTKLDDPPIYGMLWASDGEQIVIVSRCITGDCLYTWDISQNKVSFLDTSKEEKRYVYIPED